MSITVGPREVKNVFFDENSDDEPPVRPKVVNQLGAAPTSEADNIEKHIQSMSMSFIAMNVFLIGPIILGVS